MKAMNECARNKKYFSQAKEFRLRIDSTLRDIRRTLKGRINDIFQTFNFAK